ncbi:MAG: tRNA (guanosine(46)-N7)-methyltransferase TrmB [Leptolyngbyaceae bacterium]|nr:tRNA (guanosine(46)-N7)-methyltransferase TrmB [Leptolyngbyaceae bacterium]
MSAVRVRQHVNPLSRKHQRTIEPPHWPTVYANPSAPLHLDIGSAHGQFLFQMAPQHPSWNFLGIEIREPLVYQALEKRDELGLTNLHFIICNANTALTPLLESLPRGMLQRVSIFFPDPWFKRRHQKRRVVQPELVTDLARVMPEGATIFLQSDVEGVAIAMCQQFSAHEAFSRTDNHWLAENPIGVSTEREDMTLEKGLPVYRAMFVKNCATP